MPEFHFSEQRLSIMIVAVTFLLAACGSDDVFSHRTVTPEREAALTFGSSTPEDGAVNVSRTDALKMIFSAALDSSTATASNVSLSAAGNIAPLTLATAGTQLTATPAQALLPMTSYTLTAGTNLAGINGEKLGSAQTVTFKTADGAWHAAQTVNPNNGEDATSPKIAINANGDAITVWYQSDGTQLRIWAKRFTPGTGWGVPQIIETNTGDAFEPQIAIDADGNAIAVWYQFDGALFNVWSNRFTPDSGWGTPELIETSNDSPAIDPQIAMDAGGNAVAVWMQFDGTRYNLQANRFTSSSGWGIAQLIETDNAGEAVEPRMAMNANGDAIVVWYQFDGTRYNIWANRFTSASGWDIAQLIETDDGDAGYPQIAIDANGNAIAVWHQYDGAHNNIWSSRFTSSTGWSAAQLVETDNTGDAYDPQIAIDAGGNAIAVWRQYDGTHFNIWANRFTPAAEWGTAQLIETDNAGDASRPRIALDSSGNAIAVWAQSDSVHQNIWAGRFLPETGWGTAQLIETDNAGDADLPRIVIDASGNAIAIWSQSDGTHMNVLTNRFD